MKRVFWFSLQLFEKFLILKSIQWDTIKMAYSCKVTVIFVRFRRSFNFLFRFSKNTHITTCIKIRPFGAQFHADRRTADMTKLRVAFRNFANAPKKKEFVLAGMKNSKSNVAKEYCWAITYGVAVMLRTMKFHCDEFRFHLGSFIYTYTFDHT